ncbi:LamG domain-containing protein [Sorangium sp. So ce1097]|uniref:LamG domain-containing protein n=1 Tax=Sorangium sp. So ce1097 TaxID=3133330 RepID=UPI003F638326
MNGFTCSCADGYQGSVCQNRVGCLSGLPTPTGVWKGENNAADSSGNGYNGTLRAGVAFAAGQVGQAFSTENGDMAIATTVAPFASLNDLTVDMWININDATGYQVLFSRNRGIEGTGYAVALSDGQLGFAVNDGASVNDAFSAPVSLSLHTWYHITVSRKANVVKLYVDCALVGQTSSFFAGTINLSPALPVTIGSEDTVPGRNFRGLIDEAAFYPAQLSDAEVSAICAAASAGVCVP